MRPCGGCKPRRASKCSSSPPSQSSTSQCIDWFHEGESKVVEVAGVRITVRFIGRKGPRARIEITAPSVAMFGSDSQNVEGLVK